MDSFLNNIVISFKADAQSLANLRRELDAISKDVSLKISGGLTKLAGSEDAKRSIGTSLTTIDTAITGGSINSIVKPLEQFKNGFTAGLMSIGAAFIEDLSDIVEEGKEVAEDLLKASRLSNTETRETMLTWGLDQSGAYGYNTAMSMLGFKSEEDLYFAPPEERELFYNTMTKYAEQYNELAAGGFFTDLLEAEVEMAQFEKDLGIEEAKFYKENLEYYKTIKQVGFEIRKFFIETLGKFLSIFTSGYDYNAAKNPDLASESDKIATESQVDNSKVYHFNTTYDHSFNNQSAAGDQTPIEASINNWYNQVIAALG